MKQFHMFPPNFKDLPDIKHPENLSAKPFVNLRQEDYLSRMSQKHILYLQLPLLDNDTKSERENFPFAGAYLDHALCNSPESEFHSSSFSPSHWDELDTRHLVEALYETNCDIIACTLYLWNIERTQRIAALLKKMRPNLKIVAGGPETAKDHPLLFETASAFDAVVTGEGEMTFPALLNYWRTGTPADYDNLALRTSKGWKWGSLPAPSANLADAQPTEETIMHCVQNRPVVYLETVRGCPLTCSYCRYYQLHTGLRMLTTEQVMHRISRFRELGAKEIRFVDPTFNARPKFTEFLAAIAELNHDQQLSFFAEIRSDTLTKEQANLMRKANFTAVEVGVQSISAEVLKNVARPTRLSKIGKGIQFLCDAGVHVVLDIMYGLPGQDLDEVKRSLDWGLAFGGNVQVQCMQTLLLPGTVLRNDSNHWNLVHDSHPPYSIQQTDHLSPDDIRTIEILLDEHPNLPADPITPRFSSRRLARLFKEQHRIATYQLNKPVPGIGNRRALLIEGANLFSHLDEISNLIDRAIQAEPDGLWQFVLVPEREEPLDLIEKLVCVIRQHPPHMLDRFASASAFEVTVSRRLYVRTNPLISNAWKDAAEELLRESFG
ncbi:radical SAM protein [Pontiellaceae bacterium B12227]|nr:radical SAM protein [Pontiellaceae bacterium B12227]